MRGSNGIFAKGTAVAALTGLDAGALLDEFAATATVNEGPDPLDNWVTGLDGDLIRKRIDAYAAGPLAELIASLPADARLRDLTGFRSILPQNLGALPASLPVLDQSATRLRFSIADPSMRHRIKIYLSYWPWYLAVPEAQGGLDLFEVDYEAPLAALSGKRITLSYAPWDAEAEALIAEAGGNMYDVYPAAYLHLKPQLKIDGIVVGDHSDAISMGLSEFLWIETLAPGQGFATNQETENVITAGDQIAIVIDNQRMPAALVFESMRHVKQSVRDGKPPMLDHLTATGRAYWQELDAWTEGLGRNMAVRWTRAPSVMLASYNIDCSYLFGFAPLAVTGSNVTLDLDKNEYRPWAAGRSFGATEGFMMLAGYFSSWLEERTLAQMLGVEALSALRVLVEANTKGVPMYQIDRANLDAVLPTLKFFLPPSGANQETMALLEKLTEAERDLLRSYVESGWLVVAPRDARAIGEWSGNGYIAWDPATGAADFHISGRLGGAAASGPPACPAGLAGAGLKSGAFGPEQLAPATPGCYESLDQFYNAYATAGSSYWTDNLTLPDNYPNTHNSDLLASGKALASSFRSDILRLIYIQRMLMQITYATTLVFPSIAINHLHAAHLFLSAPTPPAWPRIEIIINDTPEQTDDIAFFTAAKDDEDPVTPCKIRLTTTGVLEVKVQLSSSQSNVSGDDHVLLGDDITSFSGSMNLTLLRSGEWSTFGIKGNRGSITLDDAGIFVTDAKGGKAISSEDLTVMEIFLKSVEFKSDHGPLKRSYSSNDTAKVEKFETVGEIYEPPEWVADGETAKGHSWPITQTMGTTVEVEAKVRLLLGTDERLLVPQLMNVPLSLGGEGGEDWLGFDQSEKGTDWTFNLKAREALPKKVDIIKNEIEWSGQLELGGKKYELALGPTGGPEGHEIFVTLGMPIEGRTATTTPEGQTVPATLNGNSLTYKRIKFMCSKSGTEGVAAGATNENKAGKLMSDWLSTKDFGAEIWSDSVSGKPIVPKKSPPSKYWSMLDTDENGERPYYGQCGQGGVLMDLSLRLLGAHSRYEHLVPRILSIHPTFVFTSDEYKDLGRKCLNNIPTHMQCVDPLGKCEVVRWWYDNGAMQNGQGCCRVGTMVFVAFLSGLSSEDWKCEVAPNFNKAEECVVMRLNNKYSILATSTSPYLYFQRWAYLVPITGSNQFNAYDTRENIAYPGIPIP